MDDRHLSPSPKVVAMVGAFPPPTHGMAAVNAAVRKRLQAAGADLLVIDLAASSLDRALIVRLGRLPKVLRGLVRLSCMRGLRNGVLYMSVSGGWGQIYEMVFLLIARLRHLHVLLHHHSFAYVDAPNFLTALLTKLAGNTATHVTLSPSMSARIQATHPSVRHVLSISNAVLLLREAADAPHTRQRLHIIGFLSNVSAEKGVFDYLDLCAAACNRQLPVHGKLAGPFQDTETERQVRERLDMLPEVEYMGPQYGEQKDSFYASIDALVFPTHYVNEAEPLVVHEAMSRGIPVIAYGRGCIPEIVSPACGLVVPPGDAFIPAALAQIEAWLAKPQAFEAASVAAIARFNALYAENLPRWEELQAELLGEWLHKARRN